MIKKYRIYPIGSLPPDLKERIAAIHAAGILKAKVEDVAVPTQDSSNHKPKVVSKAVK
jgi:hypothetical protein